MCRVALVSVSCANFSHSIRGQFFIASLLFIPAHLAQAADAGSLLLERQQQQHVIQQLQLPSDSKDEKKNDGKKVVKKEVGQSEADKKVEAQQTLVIKKLLFIGKTDLLSNVFKAELIANAQGKRFGINGIVALTQSVTAHLQQQGRLLARATLPQQDITGGTVTIDIIDGYLAEIQSNYIEQKYTTLIDVLFDDTALEHKTPVRVNQEKIDTILDEQVNKNDVTKASLEEALLRINDHPGVIAQSRLVQGEKTNSSKLVVDVKQQPIFMGSASVDNFGSYSTGQEQVRAEATFTDTTGYGDVSQISLVASQGQVFARGAVSLPIQTSDFTVSAGYSFLDYENTDDTGRALELEGHANFFTLGLDYSAIRSRNLNVRFNTNLNAKTLVDDSIFGTLQDKRSFSGSFGVAADIRDTFMGGGATYLSSSWTFGDIDLSGVASALEADEQSLKTDGEFQRINFSLARIQKLPDTFSLFARVYGQWANNNLDSSEGFILGGPTGVRGWAVGEANGDMGMLSTIELRYDLPTSASTGRVQLSTFIDAGRIWINQESAGVGATNACGCNSYNLSSVGVSARWEHPYFTLLSSYAQGLGDNPGRTAGTELNADNTDNSNQFWLSATAKF